MHPLRASRHSLGTGHCIGRRCHGVRASTVARDMWDDVVEQSVRDRSSFGPLAVLSEARSNGQTSSVGDRSKGIRCVGPTFAGDRSLLGVVVTVSERRPLPGTCRVTSWKQSVRDRSSFGPSVHPLGAYPRPSQTVKLRSLGTGQSAPVACVQTFAGDRSLYWASSSPCPSVDSCRDM